MSNFNEDFSRLYDPSVDYAKLMDNIWLRECGGRGNGADPKTGRYKARDAANGIDVGPGFDLEYQSDEIKKKAATVGFTEAELDSMMLGKLRGYSLLIDRKLAKMNGGVVPVIPGRARMGLMDMMWQRGEGVLEEYPKLLKHLKNGSWEGMREECGMVYYDSNKKKKKDVGRTVFRQETYFHDRDMVDTIDCDIHRHSTVPLDRYYNRQPQPVWRTPVNDPVLNHMWKMQNPHVNYIDIYKNEQDEEDNTENGNGGFRFGADVMPQGGR